MTTAIPSLTAETREQSGKGAARSLRRDGKIPGILYGKGSEPVALTLSLNEVRQQYLKGRFRSRLVELKMGGKTVQALPRDVQMHPVTDVIEHVDFLKVEAGTTVRVEVPVKFLNVEKAIGIKRGGALNIVRHEIEFICKPDSIPAHIEVNVQNMDIGSSLHINEVTLPSGITPVIQRNFTIATIAGRGKEEEETPAATAAAAPAAGAAAPAADAKKEEAKK